MRLFYLVSAVVIAVLILVISFAQLGATCTWYIFSTSAPAFLILLQMSALGAVVGGLLVLFWKAPHEGEGEGRGE